MPVTTGFNHVATVTADLDRLKQFYADAFEATVTFEMAKADDHPRMAILDLGGGAALNVFEVRARRDRRRPPQAGRSRADRPLRARRRRRATCSRGCATGSSPPAARSARSSGWAPSGRCSSATSTAWSSRSARTPPERARTRCAIGLSVEVAPRRAARPGSHAGSSEHHEHCGPAVRSGRARCAAHLDDLVHAVDRAADRGAQHPLGHVLRMGRCRVEVVAGQLARGTPITSVSSRA